LGRVKKSERLSKRKGDREDGLLGRPSEQEGKNKKKGKGQMTIQRGQKATEISKQAKGKDDQKNSERPECTGRQKRK